MVKKHSKALPILTAVFFGVSLILAAVTVIVFTWKE